MAEIRCRECGSKRVRTVYCEKDVDGKVIRREGICRRCRDGVTCNCLSGRAAEIGRPYAKRKQK